MASQGRNALAQIHIRQAFAIGKSFRSQLGHAVGNGDRFQPGAVVKGTHTDGFQGIRQRDFLGRALKKGINTDPGHALLHHDALYPVCVGIPGRIGARVPVILHLTLPGNR